MSEFLTVKELAPLLKKSEAGLWRAIRENQFPFPFVKIGREIRVPKAAIESFGKPDEQKGNVANA